MTKFSDFIARTPDEAPRGMAVDGSFGCQFCFEQVDEATYYMVEKLLKWSCSEGHVSFIEDFSF